MTRNEFRHWIFENYNLPADNLTMAPQMLEDILDYASSLPKDKQHEFLGKLLSDLPRDVIHKVRL